MSKQLQRLAAADEPAEESESVVAALESAGAGIEAVEPILRFMEEHGDLDFGMPGPLVHFVEGFHRKGYEVKLLQSLRRKPTAHTVWMLNRVINGTKAARERTKLIAELESAARHPHADEESVGRARKFLALLAK